jgi:hypothetical protein
MNKIAIFPLLLSLLTCSGKVRLGDSGNNNWELLTISSCEPYMASVYPNLARFVKTTVGNTSAAETITVTNTGSSTITLASIEVTAPFSISGVTTPVEITSEQSITFDVQFTPTAAQEYSGEMVLSFAELPETKTIDLWGVGLSAIPIVHISGGTISEPEILDAAGTTYALDGDLTCSRTCFSIQAENITLDLSGHTVTYATQTGTSRAFGILYIAGYVVNEIIGDNPKGGFAKGAHIKGDPTLKGKIVQGGNASEGNHGIMFYFGNPLGDYVLIENISVDVTSVKSQAIYLLESGGNVIRNSTFTSHAEDSDLYNRHQLEGYIIKFESSRYKNIFADNTVTGGPQGGIIAPAPESQIYRNNIQHEGHLTNDFGIGGAGKYSEVFQNMVAPPLSGRGIYVGDEAAVIRNNTINVIESPWNREYGGCQGMGTYGIQLEADEATYPDGSYIRIFGNEVVARASDCDGRAMRVTGAIRENLICNNSFRATREGDATGRAVGASFSATHQLDFDSVILTDNLLEADGNNVSIDWEGTQNIKFFRNLIRKGTNPASDYCTIYFGNVDPGSGHLFADSTFENGAGYDSYRMLTQGSGTEDADSQEFFVAWTVKFTVRDGSEIGPVVNGATVKVEEKNGSGDPTYTSEGTTESGVYSPLLREYRRYNTFSSPSEVEYFTPHLVTVTASGFTTYSQAHIITGNNEITIVLNR